MGIFAARLARWLKSSPKLVHGLNLAAGVTFIVSGLSVAALRQK